ncbi:unnamed protein product [Cyprideis torosa]|uniref:DNA topoisomerase 2 n=1 Tax=Cyprideis torosa TaxID=163714 RepID=A0A7R8ZRI8_9CRUS|nr:unnamed protein product [Cyprideis torosa]CAG0893186.1 unnamed protein product [Cyprideis torosa]
MAQNGDIRSMFAKAASSTAAHAAPDASAAIDGGNMGDVPAKKKKMSVERIYQKKTQLEHILLRPDTYIGSVEPVTQTMWVYDNILEKMVNREITFVPGLYKIFDEILVNAADNKQRDKSMDMIKVDIDAENNTISVWNNGQGIPIEMHKVEKMYVPTMIFGHLLTSSNYNDEEEKVTGGRNGFGAKLTNIFSTKFTVETASKESKKVFKQSWSNNMSKPTDPKVKEFHGKDYTKITFAPDLAKFKMETLNKDIVDLLSRRAFDLAGCAWGVRVQLNGKTIPIKTFKDYVEHYVKDREDENGDPLKICYEKVNDRWEIAATVSDAGFQNISFVNSIATTKGGRHVDYVADQITKTLIEQLKKKNKSGVQIKPMQVKNHLWVFVNCLIVNPTFSSQTKEEMTLQSKQFGSTAKPSEKFLTQLSKVGIVESCMAWAKFKAQNQLQSKFTGKKANKLKGIPKLEDANDAGTKNSLHCTLILTEGDSAKTLAVSGLGVIGRDRYGVFPLRGKLLNVREAAHKQILENAEINNLVKIVGLQYKKKYEAQEEIASLRYGKIMIMTDQDQDGSHIKGLLINFVHHNWPALLKHNFLEEFITPIVKASKGNESLSFYSLPEFEEWKAATNNWHTYKIKYYKGLGTSTSKEAKEYFQDMARHRIKFKYEGPIDDHNITMAFSKKAVDQRKTWLTEGMEERKRRRELHLPEIYLYQKDTKAVTYSDFVNKELILFSNLDNERSIPSLMDGFKPGQRKVVFTCFKRNLVKEIKVAQLAGSVAEHSAYHHGEASLMGTIIGLAQNFVGSNNINVLMPIGQFGTRLQGGKDAASPRYIFTQLSPLAKNIFHPHDAPLLNYLKDDNLRIEPEWYCPIIPMVLVNGADGIGTGWMTKIPNYNPREIVANIRRMMDDEEPLPMIPWFKNFRGTIVDLDNQRHVINGELAILSNSKLEITELPVRTWTQAYKESVMEPMLHGSEKTPSQISDYKEYHTDTTVRFVVTMAEDKMMQAEQAGLHKVFKLQSSGSTSSMVLFDHLGCLRKYDTVEEILQEFFKVRLEYYEKRKTYLTNLLGAEARKLTNQARFILEVCSRKLIVENKKKKVIIAELKDNGYDSDPVKKWKQQRAQEEKLDDVEDEMEAAEAETAGDDGLDYDYLLGMNIWSLTQEKKDELLKKKGEKLAELDTLKSKSPKDLWNEDLDAFLEELDKVEAAEQEAEASGAKTAKGLKAMGGKLLKPKKLAAEALPSPQGQRVEPKMDEVKQKAAAAVAAKANKGKGRGKKGGLASGVGMRDEEDEKDEFEDFLKDKPLKDRLLQSPNVSEEDKAKLKGKTLFKAEKGSKKEKAKKEKDPFDSDEEDDIQVEEFVPIRERIQRGAAQKAQVNFTANDSDAEDEDKARGSDEVSSPESEPDMTPESESDDDWMGGGGGGKKKKGKKGSGSVSSSPAKKSPPKKARAPAQKKKAAPAPARAPKSPIRLDSSDEDEAPAPPGPSSENLFDSLLTSPPKTTAAPPLPSAPVPSSDEDDFDNAIPPPKASKEKKKAAPKKRPATAAPKGASGGRKKKKKNSDSESDDDFVPLDDEDEEEMASVRAAAAGGGRRAAAKRVKYNFDSSDGEEDF